jgi:MipA family protein
LNLFQSVNNRDSAVSQFDFLRLKADFFNQHQLKEATLLFHFIFNSRHRLSTRLIRVTLLIVAPMILKAEEPPVKNEVNHWGVGFVIDSEQSPYKGINNRTIALPLINFENKYVHVVDNVFDFKLKSSDIFNMSIRAKIALGEGYKASDSSYLEGMETRRGTIGLGLVSSWQTPHAKVSLGWSADISGHSKGQELKFGIEHSFVLAHRLEITPNIDIKWLNANYVDYYYGVKENEVKTSRPGYVGKATTNLEGGIRFGYLLYPNQRLFLEVNDTYWDSAITNSPIVGKSSSSNVRLGYLYQF